LTDFAIDDDEVCYTKSLEIEPRQRTVRYFISFIQYQFELKINK